MVRREWGVRDRRTGQVWRSHAFADAQHVANGDSARLELVTRLPGGEWVGVEWFEGAMFGRRLTPPPPAAGRRVGLEESLGRRAKRQAVYRLYVAVRGLIFGEQGLFRRHNG